MKSRILQDLRHQAETVIPHSALPSLRDLARHFRASPTTVQRALRELSRAKLAYALPRKGYFWGDAPPPARPLPLKPASRLEALETGLLGDFRTGYLSPFARLPALKVLAHRYGASTRTMASVLAKLADKGVLARKGHGYHPRMQPRTTGVNDVILITRCDAMGKLLLDSDREMDFLKSAYQESQALNLDLKIIGYDSKGRFLDSQGRKVDPEDKRKNLLGTLVSTWLIPDADRLLAKLKSSHQPISVWWEHPAEELPPSRLQFPGLAFFNLAFGDAPGILVAESLLSQGHERILFLSPFHQSRWSQSRLRGLIQGLSQESRAQVLALTSEAHASPWSFQEEAWNELRNRGKNLSSDDPQVLRRKSQKLARAMRMLLHKRPPGWLGATAWVCVNDEVAEIAMPLARAESGGSPPYFISFDNSMKSYKYQIDSFGFNTSAMVRDMLYHITHPKAEAFAKHTLIELVGRVVKK